ncbi:MAG: peptidylprolyl isomerase [Gammaproteobacteria bacterium]|nr:MAG: peptidylprolyl isomerase [Gammaproteobacteria bacterium]
MITFKTNLGNIKISLDFDKAPISAENFTKHAQDGYYNGTIFHRVIKGFMAQAGGFSSGMGEKETNTTIKNEANNGLSNKRGTLAMARTDEPHSASAQFFINLSDNDFLDHKNETNQGWGYCVFGEVVEGMDVVEKMVTIPTGRMGFHDDVPKEEIIIEDVIIED